MLFQVDSVAGSSAGEPDPDNPFSRRGEVKKGHGKSKVTFENFEYIKVSNLRRVMMSSCVWNDDHTTLQSMMNAKLSPHRFWPCHENGLIETIQTIPHNPYVSFKSTSLCCGLRIILVYPNPQ